MVNSTLSGNIADSGGSYGGGIFSDGSATVVNSTLSGNQSNGTFICHCIYNRGALTLGNTIIKSGSSYSNICNYGTVNSLGYNLSNDDGGGFLTETGDQINTDPILGPLQNNGGPTFTHNLLTGSPALDAGDPNFTPPPLYDQRGFGYARVFNGRIDIGSLEVQPAFTPSPTPTATSTATPTPTATATDTPTATPTATEPPTTASYFTDPTPSTISSPTEVVLRKELSGVGNYGASDLAADILYTGEVATWHFVLPLSIDPDSLRAAFFRMSLVADDHYGVDLSQYTIAVRTNGIDRFNGLAGLPHGAPSGTRFTNWVQQDYDVAVSGSSYSVTLFNTSATGSGDWIAVDWIELHLLLSATPTPTPTSTPTPTPTATATDTPKHQRSGITRIPQSA